MERSPTGVRAALQLKNLGRLLAPVVALMLMAADCGAWVDWRLDVDGRNGRVRVVEPEASRGLYDLPFSLRGSDLGSIPPVRLAAVPDCGYETVAWSFGDETFEPNPEFWDPTITVVPGNDWGTPGRFTPRLLEVSFAPSTTVRNDCFATPHELPHDGLTGAVEFENATAGFEAGEPMHGGSDGGAGASLWWTFHAPADGELKMWLESDFASILAVYEGSSVTDLDAVASCVSSECREISVPVPEGALLRILVDGVGFREPSDPVLAVGETGWGALFWELLPVAESEVSVAIDPTTVSLEPGAVQTFTATVKGARDPSVSWWSTCGSLDPSGLMATYTALNEGTCEVTVTSTEDVNAWASAVVTVVASD